MRRLPGAMPKTISAADGMRRSGRPDAWRGVADLWQALAAVECHFTVGGPAGVPAGLLRDLVVITGRLAGPAWLDAHADRAGFAALSAAALPPLPELDQILAGVLSSRFSLSPAVAAA